MEFFKTQGIKYYKEFKQINGEIIVNHFPSKGSSLNGWRIKCLDERRNYNKSVSL
jgi:hypothetical protein